MKHQAKISFSNFDGFIVPPGGVCVTCIENYCHVKLTSRKETG